MGFFDFLFGKPKTYHSDERSLAPSRHSSSALTSSKKKTLNVLNLLVGDIITYDLKDYIIQNRYVYESHGFHWYSYHLVDSISGDKFWIDAQDDDELEIAVVKPVRMNISQPIPDSLFHEGRKYFQDEHGYATVTIESEESTPKYVEVEYWDYYDESEEFVLGVERWETEFEVTAGTYIEPYELNILPGADHA